MASAPSRLMEAVVGVLIPPACREHVLGDLHERYTSPQQYIVDALRTVPLVIVSRIRRTTDPEMFLMEAMGLYISFLFAAWLDSSVLNEEWGLARLAFPAAVMLVAITLEDAYATPRRRSPLRPIQEAAFGVGFAFLSQAALGYSNSGFALPVRTMLFGSGVSLLLVAMLRTFFPSSVNRFQGATTSGPLVWRNPVIRVMEYVGAAIVVAAVILLVAILFYKRA